MRYRINYAGTDEARWVTAASLSEAANPFLVPPLEVDGQWGNAISVTEDPEPHVFEIHKEGKTFWIDFVNGVVTCGGNLTVSTAALQFVKFVESVLTDQINDEVNRRMKFSDVTRLVVVDQAGTMIDRKDQDMFVSIQDHAKTLKLFITPQKK